jgi:Tfp pilus assembly protein PilF
VAWSLNNLACALQDQRKLPQAETLYREAFAVHKKLSGSEHRDVALLLRNIGDVLADQGKLVEAETMLREALAMRRKLLANEDPAVHGSLHELASVLRRQGRLAEAEALQREALELARKSATTKPKDLESRMHQLADDLYRQGKFADAEPLYRETIKSRQAHLRADDDQVISGIASLARLLADWAWDDRHQHAQVSSRPAHNGSGATPSETRAPHERAEEAERLLRDCLAARMRGPKATDAKTEDIRSRLGGAVLAVAVTDPALTSKSRQAKFSEAESLLLPANEALQQSAKAESKYKRDSLLRLVHLYEGWSKADKAVVWQKKLAEFDNAEAAKTAEKAVAAQP